MEGVHNFFEGLGCQISLALDWQADMEIGVGCRRY